MPLVPVPPGSLLHGLAPPCPGCGWDVEVHLSLWEAGSVRSKSGSQENRLRISLVEAILGYLSGTWFPLQSKSSVQPCARPPA